MQFGFSPEQMNLREPRRVPEERVSGKLDIPAIVAGLDAGLDRFNFANMVEAREMAYESNIIPTQQVITEVLNHQLLQRNYLADGRGAPRLELFFYYSNVRVLEEDENEKAIRWGSMVAGWFAKVSEARRAFNLSYALADEVYLRSATLVEVRPGQPAPTAREPRDSADDDDEGSRLARAPDDELTQADDRQRRLIRRFLQSAEGLEPTLAADLERQFNALGRRVARVYRGLNIADTQGDLDDLVEQIIARSASRTRESIS